jgi:hypothetical protein
MTLATAAIDAGVAFGPASPRMVRVTLSRSAPERSIYSTLGVMRQNETRAVISSVCFGSRRMRSNCAESLAGRSRRSCNFLGGGFDLAEKPAAHCGVDLGFNQRRLAGATARSRPSGSSSDWRQTSPLRSLRPGQVRVRKSRRSSLSPPGARSRRRECAGFFRPARRDCDGFARGIIWKA